MNKEILLKLSKRVNNLFVENEVKWKFGEEYRTPTVEEISDALDSMSQTLYAKDQEWSQIMMGQMILVKKDNFVDVYVRLDELNVLEKD